MVCGGLPAFHRFHRLSSQILVVVCGDLWLFAVVCDGLSYSHTRRRVQFPGGTATGHSLIRLIRGVGWTWIGAGGDWFSITATARLE